MDRSARRDTAASVLLAFLAACAPEAPPTASEREAETPTAMPTFTPTPELPDETHAIGDTRVRSEDGMVMVYVPRGEFEMGAMGGGDTGRLPIHTVVLDRFWLDRTEVTNGRYGACVAAGVCDPSSYEDTSMFNGRDQPVVGITCLDAQAYCTWAGDVLPSEAQ